MSTNDWMHEMHTMLEIFHQQATISLQRIIASLEADGRSFDFEFRDIFFKMSSNTLTSAFIAVESEHRLRRLTNQQQKFAHFFMPSNQTENDAQSQLLMDNAMESDAVNVKVEFIQSTSSNPVNLAATLPADAIVIDSSDDENDDIPDVPATFNIDANRDDLQLTNNNEADETAPDDPARNANCQQISGPTCSESEVENMASDEVPSGFTDTDNLSHETQTVGQNGTAEAASALNEETNALSDLNANDDANDESTPTTSSNVAETPPPSVEVDVENQDPHGPVSMKKCRLCPFVSRFRCNLKKHMQNHAGQRKPYQCHICWQYFASPDDVEKHLRYMRHGYRFYCTGCSRGFFFVKLKVEHEKKCKKSRVYECYVCHFAMRRLSTLEIHIRNHTGDKPYKCVECFKRYAYLNDLNVHLTVHATQNVIELSDDEN